MKTWLLTFNLLCAADATTTHVALHNHYAIHEALWPTQNPIVLDTIAAGGAITTTLSIRAIQHDHPRFARFAVVAATVARAVIVVHNVRVLREGARLQRGAS